MSKVNLTINGKPITADSGRTVLEVATELGIEIPTLCHHPALASIGACRMCLIEVSARQPLHPACTYQVSEGLEVQTHSPRVESARRFVLELLFSERNHYCMYCETSGNCELQDLGYRYNLDHWQYPTYTKAFPVDATRATFMMDHNRCILCRRCVRACSELVANHTLGMRQRGAQTMITADLNTSFGDSSCIECGSCLQVCPTGALIDKRSAYMDMGRNVEVERVKSTCSQCSVGCGIEILLREGNLVRVEGDWDATPSSGVVCKMGRFEPLYDERQRITAPLIRKNGHLEAADWEQALTLVAERLSSTPPAQVGVLASAQASNEALYLVKALFQEGLGVDNSGLLGSLLPKVGAAHGRLAQIAGADLILIVGADPVREQPVVSFLIKKAVDRGARLIVVGREDSELASFAQRVFALDDLDQAIEIAARADAPVVLYGTGATAEAAAQLSSLDKAIFVALEPGANSRGAEAQNLNGGGRTEGVKVLYLLLGEGQWNAAGDAQAHQLPEDAFVVVQASYASAATERADVVLPSAIWCEQSGTYTNLEGVVHRAQAAILPKGEARQDWDALAALAEMLGKRPATTLDELSSLAIAGLD